MISTEIRPSNSKRKSITSTSVVSTPSVPFVLAAGSGRGGDAYNSSASLSSLDGGVQTTNVVDRFLQQANVMFDVSW